MYIIPMRQVLRVTMATALAAAVLVAVSPDQASAAGPCTRTYSSAARTPIPDAGDLVLSVIDVPEDGMVVTDVNVAANIRHSGDGDLDIWVDSMSELTGLRATAILFQRHGGRGDNLVNTVWDDAAANHISTGTAPFTGTFKPWMPLSAMNGFTGGTYRLVVVDRVAGDEGTLDNWSVTLTYATCDVDGDGLDVPADLCPNQPVATTSGCPTSARSLSAKHRSGKFRGALLSSTAACNAGRAVSVFRVRPGADRRVGTATTRVDGSYSLKRAKKKGRYYATSPLVVVPDAAECPAVQSRTFRVR